MGPAKPAQSLRESEWLLEQDAARGRFLPEAWFAVQGFGGIVGFVLLIVCIVGAVFGVLNILVGPLLR